MNYLALVAGKIKEIAGLVASAGAGDAGKIPALDSNGKLDLSLLPTGIGADTKLILASEAIGAGKFVNVYLNASTLNVRLADASNPAKEANGFVLEAVDNAANATVYFRGTNNEQSGLTVGATQFLSASTPGNATNTPPSTGGQIVQQLGKSTASTEIQVSIEQPIELV